MTEPVTKTHTLLDELEAEIKRDVSREPITLVIPDRPKVSVRYSATVTNEQIKNTQRKSRRNGPKGPEVDEMKAGGMFLAEQCEAILMNGTEVVDSDGDLLRFGSEEIMEWLGAQTAAGAVLRLYNNDLSVISHVDAVMTAAGAGEDAEVVEDEDPTKRS